jgi:uncharacterized protein
MPEYLAPGVFVEEVSVRGKSIRGVSTTTTGFVGPTRFGPTRFEPHAITCLSEFERIYGDGRQLDFSDAGRMNNYLWHAARAFFAQGGRRLYISRAFLPSRGDSDAIARATVPVTGGGNALEVRARFPGAAGNVRVRITVRLGANLLDGTRGARNVAGLQTNDVVWIGKLAAAAAGSAPSGELYLVTWDETEQTWRFGKSRAKSAADRRLSTTTGTLLASAPLFPSGNDEVRTVTLAVTVLLHDGSTLVWDGLPPDPAHERAGMLNGLCARFHAIPSSLDHGRVPPLVITGGGNVSDGLDVLGILLAATPSLRAALDNANSTDADRSVDVMLSGGDDGARPTAFEYEGSDDPVTAVKSGLRAFEDSDLWL